jgi:transposase
LLNAALQNRICKLLAKGSSIRSACILCGIGERTYHDWQRRGETGEEAYATFFSAATRARETHKARLIAIVMRAGDRDARHAEWLLERQFPQEFALVAARDLRDLKESQSTAPFIVNTVHHMDELSLVVGGFERAFLRQRSGEISQQAYDAEIKRLNELQQVLAKLRKEYDAEKYPKPNGAATAPVKSRSSPRRADSNGE